MLTPVLLSALIVAGPALVHAHGVTEKIIIDGVAHAGFNPSYPPDWGSTAVRPSDNADRGFTDYTTTKVACGSDNPGTDLETLDVQAGSTVTWQWSPWPDSHKGPSDFYLGRCPDSGCDGVAADSLQWFKIQEETFDGTAWPTDEIVRTSNADVTIPASIAGGQYLLRHSLLAMHTPNQPQVYPYCVQINLASEGTVTPAASDLTTFPAAYTINTDFITWNLYAGDQSLFVPPGPAVFNAGGGNESAPAPAPSSTPSASDAAPVPSSSDSAAVPSSSAPSSSSAQGDAPAPTDTGAAPPSSSDSVAFPSSTASSAAPPPASTSTSPAPPTGGALGGPAPAVTESGGRFLVDGGSYADRTSAVQASCMSQMNKCKDAANALANADVAAGLSACDAQLATCKTACSVRKRSVVNRYAKKRTVGPRF